jgi:hypothetical protein
MTKKIRRYAKTAFWLSSLAYAAKFKRAGRHYFVGAVCAVTAAPEAVVVMNGPLPGLPMTGR